MLRILTPFLICSVFLSQMAWAEKYILVRKIQGMEQLPPAIPRQLEKITLKVVTKQPDLRLLLSASEGPENSVDMLAVDSEVARVGKGYRIEARLLNLRTRRLLNKAELNNIREEDLLRLFESALETLFIPLRKKPSEKEADDRPAAQVSKRPPRSSTTYVNTPDHQTLDFRKRVRDLKFGVDKQIAEVKDEKEASKNEEAKKENKLAPSPAKPHTAKVISEEKYPDEKGIPAIFYPSSHRFSAGFESRSIYSEYLVATTAKASILNLDASGRQPFWLRGTTGIGYELGYSRALSAPGKAPSLYRAGLFGSYIKPLWNIEAGLSQESSFFVNLPNPGAGLSIHSLTSTWLKLKGEFILDYRGPWLIFAEVGLPIMAETNYELLKEAKSWQGTALVVSVTPPYQYKKFECNIAFERINLTTQGERPFTLNESRFAFSVQRSL